jgi:Protein of unknown function (DUF1549)/Protein of unknown function (DUF1553)
MNCSDGLWMFCTRGALSAIASLLLMDACRAADSANPEIAQLRVIPRDIRLDGPQSRFTLLVDGRTSDGRSLDLTASSTFRSRDPKIAVVSGNGIVRGIGDGKTAIEITAAGREAVVRVSVKNARLPRRYHFENDVVPILSRFGCNSGGCHGKAEGQNGFKLSVFGFDPAADWKALVSESRGRRLNPAAPDRSLLLTKASGGVPHGGGVRIKRGSAEYRTLRGWIAAGMPMGDPNAPRVVSLKVTPSERRLAMKSSQQLRVVATCSDGRQVDVTAHAKFQTNNESRAKVDEFGLVTAGDAPGEAAIMAGYMGAVDVFRTLIPQTDQNPGFSRKPGFSPAPVRNFIDRHVDAKLAKLNIASSGLCDDATFLRRVFLDLIGTLPTATEARAFLADKRGDKRRRLVDALLQRREFADYWALKWADVLRVDRQALGHKGAYAYYEWIRDGIAANKRYDRFVTELLTAEGPLRDAPAGYFYKVVPKPGNRASTLSQVLLGVRIECAQCHHHPFDQWSQTDYYGMQAYFTQVGFKKSLRGDVLTAVGKTVTKHPRTRAVVYAHPLGTTNPKSSPPGDRRKLLAKWMTSPANPWFAKNLVNRVWAHLLGRGIIEPVDDVRSTNPPGNPELLDALAKDFVAHGYDIHHLIRRITASRTYQLSSHANPGNERDEQNHSRQLFKRLEAEVLLDAVCQVTGVPEKFDGVPSGYRAIQLWDSHVPHEFLKLFGRPVRASACECERSAAPSVSQVLHVLNSPHLQGKLSHAGGRIARLVRRHADDGKLVDELYLTIYSRFPTKAERAATAKYLGGHKAHRQRAAEDVAWSMMNTVEFLFRR